MQRWDMLRAMRLSTARFVVCACLAMSLLFAADLPGRLQLVDAREGTTPVQYLEVALRSLDKAPHVRANPDKTGRFTLTGVAPGRYALDLPFFARYVSVTLGGRRLTPPEFEVKPGESGPLEIVISMKNVTLTVDVHGLPSSGEPLSAVLAPADPNLTIPYSCRVNRLPEPYTEFRAIPPGQYRLYIVSDSLATTVSGYAPRFPEFLKEQAPAFRVSAAGDTKVTADYIDSAIVNEAIRQAGPLKP